jgi:tRNA threonylcarbamoyladenosine biosynthesis protein TsaE
MRHFVANRCRYVSATFLPNREIPDLCQNEEGFTMAFRFTDFSHYRVLETRRAEETQALGERIAQLLGPGDLITLRGDLGAGKTTLTQGIARGLGAKDAVTSPTFVLMLEYSGRVPLLHLDAYRLENLHEDELGDAGIWDFLERRDAVKIVEWPERIEAWLPRPRLEIEMKNAGENAREIVLRTDETFFK